jgi:hypothetical protein
MPHEWQRSRSQVESQEGRQAIGGNLVGGTSELAVPDRVDVIVVDADDGKGQKYAHTLRRLGAERREGVHLVLVVVEQTIGAVRMQFDAVLMAITGDGQNDGHGFPSR